MTYQLVLQFRGDTSDDYERLIALEDRLIEALGDLADVDGHDCGSGEANIFILTSDPAATFQTVRQLLQQECRLEAVVAAYRPIEGENYTVIWPQHSQAEFKVA